jgi:hypothetical protein
MFPCGSRNYPGCARKCPAGGTNGEKERGCNKTAKVLEESCRQTAEIRNHSQ